MSSYLLRRTIPVRRLITGNSFDIFDQMRYCPAHDSPVHAELITITRPQAWFTKDTRDTPRRKSELYHTLYGKFQTYNVTFRRPDLIENVPGPPTLQRGQAYDEDEDGVN